MWDLTVEPRWIQSPATSTAPATFTARETHKRSFPEVWCEAHSHGLIGELEVMIVIVGALTSGASVFSAWLLLPIVYGGGSGWAAYQTALKAVISGFGVLWFMSLVNGTLLVFIVNQEEAGNNLIWEVVHPGVLVILMFASAGILVYWLSAAARGVAQPLADLKLPPLCEACGYDLTELPEEARCPECGMQAAESLSNTGRLGCAWQVKKDVAAWVESAWDVIARPSSFYRRLRLREDAEMPRRFARPSYPLVGAMFGGWLFVMFLIFDPNPGDVLIFVPLGVMFLISLLAWLIHRFVGALAASWWIVHATLPNCRWGETVIRYESAFLWMFLAMNVGLLTTYWTWGEWMSDLQRDLGIQLVFGMPLEPLAVLLLNVALSCIWLYRYHIAAKAVRWSNF